MAPKRNNMIPNAHLRKHWQPYVKTWFNQPARKKRRYNKRLTKSKAVAPRPLGKLRPIVRCSSIRYNTKERLGKGFTIPELKGAGICKKEAMGIGISVDYKRKNRSVEAMQKNIQRLKEYKSKLILFPKKKKKPKKTDSKPEECAKAQQLKGTVVMPLAKQKPQSATKQLTKKDKRFSAYNMLQREKRIARTWGLRAKKALEAAEDAAAVAPSKK